MSEMLGNQYFMARNYSAAEVELEECLKKYPDSKAIRKKLIICYTQTGKNAVALNLFQNLIKEDITYILSSNFIEDDCPCPELINKIEVSENIESQSADYYITLGMIWLYCSPEKSLENFEKAKELDKNNTVINNIIAIIKAYIQKVKAV